MTLAARGGEGSQTSPPLPRLMRFFSPVWPKSRRPRTVSGTVDSRLTPFIIEPELISRVIESSGSRAWLHAWIARVSLCPPVAAGGFFQDLAPSSTQRPSRGRRLHPEFRFRWSSEWLIDGKACLQSRLISFVSTGDCIDAKICTGSRGSFADRDAGDRAASTTRKSASATRPLISRAFRLSRTAQTPA